MMTEIGFSDGSIDTPGCNCGDECQLPCWQRVGFAPACEACGCPPFPPDAPQPPPDVLDAARSIVRGKRETDYGDPGRNLKRIGMIWGILLDRDSLTAREVAVMLAAMKIVRAAGRNERDDLVDLAGYVLLADEASTQ